MPISINGTGTITGISAGGLPSGIITGDTISNGSISTADIADGSITAPKLGYQNFNFRNRIINGDMRIDQRNAGAAITPTTDLRYLVDRWRSDISQVSKITFQQQAIASPQSCDGNRYTLACSTASAYTPTSTDYFGVNQLVEGFNTADLLWGTSAAKTATLSFWVYSGLTGSFGGAIRTGDSSNYSYPFIYTINSANTWEKKTITILAPTSGTWGATTGAGLDVWFSLGTGSAYTGAANTWAAANYLNATGAINMVSTASGSGGTWYITGVQLEVGSTATDFERRPIGTELALCQRYYEVLANDTEGVGITSFNYISTQHRHRWYFKATKRASPTVNIVSGSWVTATPTIYPSVDCCGFYNPSSLFSSNNAGGLYALAEL